jgi:hypothetical protein
LDGFSFWFCFCFPISCAIVGAFVADEHDSAFDYGFVLFSDYFSSTNFALHDCYVPV